MNYGDAEIEIANFLNEKFLSIDASDKYFVAPMPDTDKEMKEFEAKIEMARATVEHTESDFDKDSSLGGTRLNETVKFRVYFEGKKMRGDGGLYTLMYHAKMFLLGHRLTNSDPFTITTCKRIGYNDSMWLPYMDIQCTTCNMQLESDDEVVGGPLVGLIPDDKWPV